MLYHRIDKQIRDVCREEFSIYSALLDARISNNESNFGTVESVNEDGTLKIKMTDGSIKDKVSPGSSPIGPKTAGSVVGGKFIY